MTKTSAPGRVWDLPVRLFHWALVVLVALLWFSGEFGGLDISVEAPVVGYVYLTNMDVHALAGQGVLVLVLFRLCWGLWGSTTARFGHFVRGPKAALAEARALVKGRLPTTTGHNSLGGLMVVALLLVLAAQTATGLFAADDLFFEAPLAHLVADATSKQLTGIHGQLATALQVLVIAHILAVVYYQCRGSKLIRAMVTGTKYQQINEPLIFAPWWLALVTLALAAGVLAVLRSL